MEKFKNISKFIKNKKYFFIFFILICAIIYFIDVLIKDISYYSKKPARLNIPKKIILIKSGMNLNSTAKLLHANGIINYPLKFKIIVWLKGVTKQLKAGEYLLSPSMTPLEILETIVSGKIFLYKITIPEGYNVYQIAHIIGESKLCSENDFLKAATDEIFVKKMGIDAKTFEGYLFPETYYLPKSVTPEKIISIMLMHFWNIFNINWQGKAKFLKLTVHEIVTLASIIEKETGFPEERAIISSVFHNRLVNGMKLESDPTIIYCIDNYNGNITKEHLTTFTTYNTYKIYGLPPGPIANPGRKSIEAALFPLDTQYFYFVSKGNKTHYFSLTFEEHNKAVQKYQLSR